MNRGAAWLARTLMPWTASVPDGAPMNMLDLLAHPEGFTRQITNLDEVGPALLAHLRAEASSHPGLMPRVDAFAEVLRERLGAFDVHATGAPSKAPVLTTRFDTAHGPLAFFSMFTTFGTPQDITLASLRVEHMFAADAVTAAVVNAQALS
jgi:hypothetical protein